MKQVVGKERSGSTVVDPLAILRLCKLPVLNDNLGGVGLRSPDELLTTRKHVIGKVEVADRRFCSFLAAFLPHGRKWVGKGPQQRRCHVPWLGIYPINSQKPHCFPYFESLLAILIKNIVS